MENSNEYSGTRLTQINENIASCCISEEASNLLDAIMEGYAKHKLELSKCNPPVNILDPEYHLAYWLVRYSGLVKANVIL